MHNYNMDAKSQDYVKNGAHCEKCNINSLYIYTCKGCKDFCDITNQHI